MEEVTLEETAKRGLFEKKKVIRSGTEEEKDQWRRIIKVHYTNVLKSHNNPIVLHNFYMNLHLKAEVSKIKGLNTSNSER